MYFDFSIKSSQKANRNKNNVKGYDINGSVIKDLPNEIWKTHPKYPNYEISNMGRVKNVIYNTLMSLNNDKDGYLLVGLRNINGRTTCRVHRLVAELFCDNPNNYTTVNHINHIKNDNRAINLEWTTLKNNVIEQNKTLSPLAKTIIYTDKNNNIIEFESIAEAADYFNIHRAAIRYRLKHDIAQRIKVDWLKGGSIRYK